MSETQANYDSPWKEALEEYVEAFLAFFFPTSHREIDWERGYEFLEQELQQIVGEAELGKRLNAIQRRFLKIGRYRNRVRILKN